MSPDPDNTEDLPVIRTGMHVELELVTRGGDAEALSLDLVPDASADFGRGFLGEGTPLAAAILGRTAGSIVPYAQGDLREIRILAVSPASAAPDEGVAARREARLHEAVEKSDRTSAMIFATSYSSKWGDYDPAPLAGSEGWEVGRGEASAEPGASRRRSRRRSPASAPGQGPG